MRFSIIIPAAGQEQALGQTLSALAAALPDGAEEVLVVTASPAQDSSPSPLPGEDSLGARCARAFLPGRASFAAAVNLGAARAKGRILFVLAPGVLARPGWVEALLDDYARFPALGATGPLLVDPKAGPLGETVRHLGTAISAFLCLEHLYEGIPLSSPLAGGRRFFQVFCPEAFAMPREFFLHHGGFEEQAPPGLEHVPLCDRLVAAQRLVTVNPKAQCVSCRESDPGLRAHAQANANRLGKDALRALTPDLHVHCSKDGLELELTPWQQLIPSMPQDKADALSGVAGGNEAALIALLQRYPLWREGGRRLSDLLAARNEAGPRHILNRSLALLHPAPEAFFALADSAAVFGGEPYDESGNAQEEFRVIQALASYINPFDQYTALARLCKDWCAVFGLRKEADLFSAWLEHAPRWRAERYEPFLRAFRRRAAYVKLLPGEEWAYTLWRELCDRPARQSAQQAAPSLAHRAIAVILPVGDLAPALLAGAVASLREQRHTRWELFLVPGPTLDDNAQRFLAQTAALDKRIHVLEVRPEEDGGLTCNTALARTGAEYVLFMDQRDRLAPDALALYARALEEKPHALLLYADEDETDEARACRNPRFKPAWDAWLLLEEDYIGHTGLYRREELLSAGAFRKPPEQAGVYDLLLRYSNGLPPERVVRIPHVLLHRRPGGAGLPGAAGAFAAASDFLREQGSAARCEQKKDGARRVYPALPSPAPLISLLADIGGEFTPAFAHAEYLLAQAGYAKKELILLCDDNREAADRLARRLGRLKNVRLVRRPGNENPATRLNAALEGAKGQYLCLLGQGAKPLTPGWLAMLAAALSRPGAGVAGGLALNKDGVIHQAGYAVASGGALFSLAYQSPEAKTEDWIQAARVVAAVHPGCLLTRSDLFFRLGGCNPRMGPASLIDYCLRAGEQGLETVLEPEVRFFSGPNQDSWEMAGQVCEPELVLDWHGALPPFHPALDVGVRGQWVLREPTGIAPPLLKIKNHSPLGKKTILIVAHDLAPGGGQYALLRLMRRLHRDCPYELAVLALGGGALQRDFEELAALEVVREPRIIAHFGFRSSQLELSMALNRLLAKLAGEPVCALANTVVSALALPCLAQLGLPVLTIVSELRSNFIVHTGPQMLMDLLRHTTRFAPASGGVAAMLQGLSVPAERIRVIHGAIEDFPTELDAERRQAFFADKGLDPALPVIWGCGSISPTKGTDLFYAVCKELARHGRAPFQAVWVGSLFHAFRSWYESVSEQKAAEARLRFCGFVEKPYRLMAPGDIFLLSSREDCFPLVMLEAAERGLPVVGFAGSGGVEDFVTEDIGLLAPYMDTAAMAAAVERLLLDPALGRRMGEQGRATVLARHTIDHMAGQILEELERLIAG